MIFSNTSKHRFQNRLNVFKLSHGKSGALRHFLWWMIHNGIAHIFLLIPCDWSFAFHDYTSDRLNYPQRYLKTANENQKRRARTFRSILSEVREDLY